MKDARYQRAYFKIIRPDLMMKIITPDAPPTLPS